MARTWLLYNFMSKNSRMLKGGKHPVLKKVGIGFLIVYCALIYGGLATFQFYTLLTSGSVGLAVSMGLAMEVLINMFLVILTLPSIFYFANDLKVYLAMPFTPDQIIAAKTLVVCISMTPFILLIALCMIIAAILAQALSIGQLILLALGMILTGYVTIVVIGILVILMMRFMPLFRDKDRFMMIFGIIASLGAVAVVMLTNNITFDETMDFTSLHIPLEFFPPAWMAYRLIMHPSLLNVLGMVLVLAVCAALFWICAKTIYLNTARNAIASGAKKRKQKTHEADRSSTLTVLMKTEMKHLLRSPTYLMNNIISGFLVPIIMIVSFTVSFSQASDAELNITELLPMVLNMIHLGEFWFAVLVGICVAWICTVFNMVCSTAISRQGRNGLHWILSIPTPIYTQLKAFTYVGSIVTLANCLILIIPVFIMLKAGWMMWLGALVGLLPAVLFENILNLVVDCLHPNLDWQDENESVKKNMNSLFGMVIMALEMLIVIVPIVMNLAPDVMVMIALGAMILGCCFMKPILNWLVKLVVKM